jgi:hypothetical protein
MDPNLPKAYPLTSLMCTPFVKGYLLALLLYTLRQVAERMLEMRVARALIRAFWNDWANHDSDLAGLQPVEAPNVAVE